jgi:hypothetical protein
MMQGSNNLTGRAVRKYTMDPRFFKYQPNYGNSASSNSQRNEQELKQANHEYSDGFEN